MPHALSIKPWFERPQANSIKTTMTPDAMFGVFFWKLVDKRDDLWFSIMENTLLGSHYEAQDILPIIVRSLQPQV